MQPPFPTCRADPLLEPAERPPNQSETRLRREPLATGRNGFRIAIDGAEAASGTELLEDGRGMTAAAERRVAVTPVCLDGESGQHLVEKYRRVRHHLARLQRQLFEFGGQFARLVTRLQPFVATLVPVLLVPQLETAALPDQHRLA